MRILMVRLSSIGDLVHTLPALSALRRRFPDATIDWLVETRHRDVLLSNPDINELVEVDTFAWRKRLFVPSTWRSIAARVREIRKSEYDVVLDFQGTIKSAVAARLARCTRHAGFATSAIKEKAASLFYSEQVSVDAKPHHVIDRHLRLLAAVDIETDERKISITIPDAMDVAANEHLTSLGLSDYAIVNPGASWVTKRWNPKKFGALAIAIEKEWHLPSLVIWGPGEEDAARRIVEIAGSSARLAPPTGVRDIIPYIRRARLFVSGDTGPMHLASASGVPVVGIFGPTDPARNGPFGPGDEVVWKNVPCGPCYKHHCPGYDEVCMTSIEVDDVLEAIRRRLPTP
jgi:lipopolysaccharide heptosyltransferase I